MDKRTKKVTFDTKDIQVFTFEVSEAERRYKRTLVLDRSIIRQQAEKQRRLEEREREESRELDNFIAHLEEDCVFKEVTKNNIE